MRSLLGSHMSSPADTRTPVFFFPPSGNSYREKNPSFFFRVYCLNSLVVKWRRRDHTLEYLPGFQDGHSWEWMTSFWGQGRAWQEARGQHIYMNFVTFTVWETSWRKMNLVSMGGTLFSYRGYQANNTKIFRAWQSSVRTLSAQTKQYELCPAVHNAIQTALPHDTFGGVIGGCLWREYISYSLRSQAVPGVSWRSDQPSLRFHRHLMVLFFEEFV